jgi:predicted metal-dependent phosphoesterase TrpH
MHVKVLDESVVERAKRRDIDVLVYAPHFTRWPTVCERAATYSDDELLVVPARELFTGDWRSRRHVLALDLQRPVPDFLTLSGAMAELDRQDAVTLVPHPGFLTISLEREHIAQYRDQLEGVEVYNPKLLPWDTHRGQGLVAEFDLPPFISSYAHLRRTVGECWTTFEAEINSADDLHAALRDGVDRRLFHRGGGAHSRARALEFGHIAYENTWKKLDRVYLSGMEPTHPDHVAYDGDFDDDSVY